MMPLAVAFAAAASTALAGCTDGDRGGPAALDAAATAPAPAPSTPTAATPSPADHVVARFEEVRAAFGELPAVETESWLVGSEQQVTHGRADFVSGDYAITGPASAGGAVEVIHVGDLTWVRAPREFWVALGYTEESATAAVGMWVLAQGSAKDSIDRLSNPGAVFAWLRRADPDDIVATEAAVPDAPESMSVTFDLDGGQVRAVFTGAGEPRLTGVTFTTADGANVTDVVGYPESVTIPIPDGDDVLQDPAAAPRPRKEPPIS